MRLIDADELEKTICNYEFGSPDKRIKHGGDIVLNFYMPKIIDDAPTIEAEPVKHGKWSFAGDNVIECSRCGEEYFSSLVPRNYCPNCGAKMDGGDPHD